MFVERAREIALQQFVVVDGLGDHMPHKLWGKKRWFYMIILRDKNQLGKEYRIVPLDNQLS